MLAVLLASLAVAAEPADWEKAESPYLKNITQVTKDYNRAGEGYFSPDGKTIIFQAEEKDTGNPFYQIFTMNLESGRPYRVSTGVGKTTCSFFRPDGKKVIFASSHLDPDAQKNYEEEYRLRKEDATTGKRRPYKWDFDPYMTIFEANPDGTDLKPLTHAKGYNAEGSYSPDGKQIVFTSNRDAADSLEIYVMDADGGHVRKLTDAPHCYNGGPFFSPERQARHLPQRPQGEGAAPGPRHQRGRDRRQGPHRRADLELLGAVLVQGRQAHHLRRRRPRHGDAAQLRPLLDEHRHGQEGAHHLRPGRRRAAGVQPGLQEVDVDLDARRQPAVAAVHRGLHAAGRVNVGQVSKPAVRRTGLESCPTGEEGERAFSRLQFVGGGGNGAPPARWRCHSRRTWFSP